MSDEHSMTVAQRTDDEDPFADIGIEPPRRRTVIGRLVAMGLIPIIVAAVLAWQLITLHDQLHSTQQANRQQTQQISQLRTSLTNLQNSYTATISCLANGTSDKTLCLQFSR